MTVSDAPHPIHLVRFWGFWAILCGAVALLVFFVQVQIMATADAAPIGQQIGEIAGEIRKSAWRSFLGLSQPEPVAPPPTPLWRDILPFAVPVFGVAAVILAVVSLFLRENWRLGLVAVGLGGSAMLFQFLWIVAVLILGVILLIAIISNMGDIFGV